MGVNIKCVLILALAVCARAADSPSPSPVSDATLFAKNEQASAVFDDNGNCISSDVQACVWAKVSQLCSIGTDSNTTDVEEGDKLRGPFKTPAWPGFVKDSLNKLHMQPNDTSAICGSFECRTQVHQWTSGALSNSYGPLQHALMETLRTVCRFRKASDGFWRRLASTRFVRLQYTVQGMFGLDLQKNRTVNEEAVDTVVAKAFGSKTLHTRTMFWYQTLPNSAEIEVLFQCFDSCTQPNSTEPRVGLQGCVLCKDAMKLGKHWLDNHTSTDRLKEYPDLANAVFTYVGATVYDAPELDESAAITAAGPYERLVTYGGDLASASWTQPFIAGISLAVAYVLLSVVIVAAGFAPKVCGDGPAAPKMSKIFCVLILFVEIGTLALSVYGFIRFCENYIVYGNWFFAAVAGIALFVMGGYLVAAWVPQPTDADTTDKIKTYIFCMIQLYPSVIVVQFLMKGKSTSAVAHAIGNRGAFLCPILAFLCLYSVLLSSSPPMMPFFGIETSFPSYPASEIAFRFLAAGFLIVSGCIAALCFARGPAYVNKGCFCFVYWLCEILCNIGGFATLGFISIPETAVNARECVVVVVAVVAVQYLLVVAVYRASVKGHLTPGRELAAALSHAPRILVVNSNRFDQSAATQFFNQLVVLLRISTFVVIAIIFSQRQPLPEPIAQHIEDNEGVRGLLGAIGGVTVAYLLLDIIARCCFDNDFGPAPKAVPSSDEDDSQEDPDSQDEEEDTD